MKDNMPQEPGDAEGTGDVCPICKGKGYLSRDLPIHHPEFGKLVLCECRKEAVDAENRQRLVRLSNLTAFKDMTFQNFKTEGRLGLGDQQVNSLKLALNSAVHFAQHLDGWLFLMGPYGSVIQLYEPTGP
jgi:DNA replication protein DnaC